jgi:molybdopterin converting factor small subunit
MLRHLGRGAFIVSTVRVPPVLRNQTGGEKEVTADGETVGEVLEELTKQHPGLRSRLFEDGSLQRFVNIYLNDQDIQYLQRMETPVGPQDTVIILPAMAGGSGTRHGGHPS